MTLSTLSFIVSGRDKVTNHVIHVRVVMTPTGTGGGEGGLDIKYKVSFKTLSPLVYWFMVKVLKYKNA